MTQKIIYASSLSQSQYEALMEYCESVIDELRKQNDNPSFNFEQTILMRGKISAYKKMIKDLQVTGVNRGRKQING